MFKIRIDSENDTHSEFTLFTTEGNCGSLRMHNDETEEFLAVLQNGCEENGIFFAIARAE